MRTYLGVFLIPMSLATLVFINLFSSSAQASHSLVCESSDKSLHIEYQYIEGDGLSTLFGDFIVSYKGKKTKTGLFNWYKWNGSEFKLTVYSLTNRPVKIIATKKTEPYGELEITSGFVVIDGKKIDLQGVEFSCVSG